MAALYTALLLGLLSGIHTGNTTTKPGAPVIEITPNNKALSLLEGETGLLRCIVVANEPAPVTWTKGPEHSAVIHEGEELRFDPAKMEDNAGYKCTATNGAGSSSGDFILGVHNVTSELSFLTDEVKLTNTHGTGGQRLTWYKARYMPGDPAPDDGDIVAEWNLITGGSANIAPGYEVDTTTGDLLIPSVTLQQDGLYTAYMKDMISSDKYGYTRLTVYVPPAEITMSDVGEAVNATDDVTMDCTVGRVKPGNITFIWEQSTGGDLIPEEPIKKTNPDGTFRVTSRLTKSFEVNGTVVTCFAIYLNHPKETYQVSKTVFVARKYETKVEKPEGDTIIGSKLTLKCASTLTGWPTSDLYYWSKDGKDITGTADIDGPTLSIGKLVVKDEGSYECRILNEGGMSVNNQAYHLSVIALPENVVISGLDKPINESDTIDVACTVPSVRPWKVTFTWKFPDEEEISESPNSCEANTDGPTTCECNEDGTWKVTNTQTHSFTSAQNGSSVSCSVKHGTRPEKDEHSVLIQVAKIFRTKVERTGDEIYPILNQAFSLRCIGHEGWPSSTDYYWYKDKDYGNPLTDGGRISIKTDVLQITGLQVEDDGEYECKILNQAGMSSSTAGYDMNVLAPPKDVHIDGLGEYVNVSVPETFTCSAPIVRPSDVTITWSLSTEEGGIGGGTNKIHDNGDGTWKVTSEKDHIFDENDDKGKLSCKVELDVASDLSDVAEKVIAITIPYVTEAKGQNDVDPVRGKSFALLCGITQSGKPASTDNYWYKNNSLLTDDDHITGTEGLSPTITNVREEDDGFYECMILNEAGMGESKPYMLVSLYGPKAKITCPGPIVEGETATFTCTVDAKPMVEGYTWKHKKKLENTDEGTHVIEIVKRTDQGNWTCAVCNRIDSAEDSCDFIVFYKPAGKPSISSESGNNIKVEDDVKFTCRPGDTMDKGFPEGTEYAWRKDGEDISGTSADSYPPSTDLVTGSGLYSCALKNDYGKSDFVETELIIEAPTIIETSNGPVYTPLYNNSEFTIEFTVSGTYSDKTFSIWNTSSDISTEYFTQTEEGAHGDFSYGQREAVLVRWKWRIDRGPQTCDNVTFYNGNYTFNAEGLLLDDPSLDSLNFSINVQYPPMRNPGKEWESSPLNEPKVLVCDVCAEPAPIMYTWTFMGNHTVNGTGRELDLGNVTSEHFGWYTCTVTNVINGAQYENTFNITLEERGSPHKPLSLEVTSRTAKTLLVQWKIAFDGGYDIEHYELTVCNYTDTCDESDDCDKCDKHIINATDCTGRVGDVCDYRIVDLLPDTDYCLKLQVKNNRTDGDSFSGYISSKGNTKDLPEVEDFKSEVTSTGITVTWMYGTPNTYTTDDSVGVVIMYKNSTAVDYTRHPVDVNQKIPAGAQATTISGTFSTSESYSFQYLVYEGDQLSEGSHHVKEAQLPQGDDPDVGMIVGVVIGCLLLIVLVSTFVVFWVRRNQGLKPRPSAGYPPTSTEDLTDETELTSEPAYAEVRTFAHNGGVSKGAMGGEDTETSPNAFNKPALAVKPIVKLKGTNKNHAYENVVVDLSDETSHTYANVEDLEKESNRARSGDDTTTAKGGKGIKPKPAKKPKPEHLKRSNLPPADDDPSLNYADLTFDESAKRAAPRPKPRVSRTEPDDEQVTYADVRIDKEEPASTGVDGGATCGATGQQDEDNGLLYADLDFGPDKPPKLTKPAKPPKKGWRLGKGQKPVESKPEPEVVVIHGADEKSDYVDLDFAQMRENSKKKEQQVEEVQDSPYCNVDPYEDGAV